MVVLTPRCVYCDQSSDQIPLITFLFKEKEHWICPQHLPILIHQPYKLVDKLPGLMLAEDADLSALE